jgi:tetratricopeptide (TPR) repeat protein
MPKAMTPEDAARVEGYIKQMSTVPWGNDPAIPAEQVRALFDETVGRVRRVAGDWSQFREPILTFSSMPKPLSYVGAAEIMFRLSFMRGQMWAPTGLRQGLRFVSRAQYYADEALPPDALVIRIKLLAGYPSKYWLELADQSLAMLQRVAPNHPRIPNAAYLIHLQRQEYEAALACVEQTLVNSPTPDEAYIALTNKATVLQKLQRYDEALGVFDQVIALDPTNAWNWHNKSLMLSDLGRDREALDCNTHALSLMQFGAAQRTRERLLAKIGD